jgi:hypothetical protein
MAIWKSAGRRSRIRRGNPSEQSDTFLAIQMQRLSEQMKREQIAGYMDLMQRPWRLIYLNTVAGIFRGVGIALGVTIITTLLVWFLNWLGALELPIIGDYIADLVHTVQKQLENRSF